jgi:hypothetical protein
MFRKSSFGIAATLLAGMLAMGCSDDSDSSSSDGVLLFTDNYPGQTTQATSWVADDQRALSHAGQTASNSEFYAMRGRDVGILTYDVTATNQLFASYWNGSTFTPPVEIQGTNDAGGGHGSIQVVWLNPSATDAVFRDGDAIIMFSKTELDNVTTTTVTENSNRLYSSYFDSSAVGTAQSGDIKYGFDTIADYVYATPQVDTNAAPDVHESVTGVYGFVSDSNYLSHTGGDAEESGQTTTFVYALWFSEKSDADATQDVRMYSRAFDLNSTNTTNTFSGTETEFAGQASTDEDVVATYTAHNGVVFFTAADDGGSGQTLMDYVNFAVGATSALASHDEGATVVSNPVIATLPTPGNVYGPDHGLLNVVSFNLEQGLGTAAAGGEDADAWMNVIDPAVTATANVAVEIDAFRGAPADVNDSAAVTNLRTRIALGGQWIGAVFQQNNVIDSSTPATTLLSSIWATVVQTAITGGTARTAALSPSTATLLTDLVGPTGTAGPTAVTAFEFQQDLATGQDHPACNVQSNHLTMNVLFDQTATSGVGNAAQLQMRVNTITAVLETLATATTTPAAVPTQTTTAANTQVDSLSITWNQTNAATNISNDYLWGSRSATAFDDGAGGAAVVYPHQNINPDADVDTTPSAANYESARLYFWRPAATTPQVISSFAPTNTLQGRQIVTATGNFKIAVLQTGITSGVDSSGNDGGTGVLVFFNQRLVSTNGRSALCSVFWDKAAANGTTVPAVGDQWLPVRSTTGDNTPFVIDNDLSASSALLTDGGDLEAAFREGSNTAALYFTQGENLWWNQFSGTTWREESGLGDPQIVSHDNETGASAGDLSVFYRGNADCFSNSSALSGWLRQDNQSGFDRLHARSSN